MRSEFLKMKFGDSDEELNEVADSIYQSTQRAANLTKQLLGFARGGKYDPEPVNMNDIIKETVDVSEKIFEKNIEVKFDLYEKLDNIEADKNQMHQMLTNLIINAKDAMPSGGELIFKTQNVILDEDYTRIYPEFKPGNYIKISITDTGTGIPQEIIDNIFEPFFTTKGVGKGTGLGLAMVYGIIKNHKGHIKCYSESGEGTTFNIYLPATQKKVIKKKIQELIEKGKELILVVDDEEEIRKSSKNILESLGYKVMLAKNGKEAINIYKDKKHKIDLILLDLVMPKMPGYETFNKLKKLDPKVKVILISGFSQNGKATKILKSGALGFVQKPFRLIELSHIIKKVLRK